MAQMIARIVERRRRQAIQEMEQHLTAPDPLDPATVAENIVRKKKATKKRARHHWKRLTMILKLSQKAAEATELVEELHCVPENKDQALADEVKNRTGGRLAVSPVSEPTPAIATTKVTSVRLSQMTFRPTGLGDPLPELSKFLNGNKIERWPIEPNKCDHQQMEGRDRSSHGQHYCRCMACGTNFQLTFRHAKQQKKAELVPPSGVHVKIPSTWSTAPMCGCNMAMVLRYSVEPSGKMFWACPQYPSGCLKAQGVEEWLRDTPGHQEANQWVWNVEFRKWVKGRPLPTMASSSVSGTIAKASPSGTTACLTTKKFPKTPVVVPYPTHGPHTPIAMGQYPASSPAEPNQASRAGKKFSVKDHSPPPTKAAPAVLPVKAPPPGIHDRVTSGGMVCQNRPSLKTTMGKLSLHSTVLKGRRQRNRSQTPSRSSSASRLERIEENTRYGSTPTLCQPPPMVPVSVEAEPQEIIPVLQDVQEMIPVPKANPATPPIQVHLPSQDPEEVLDPAQDSEMTESETSEDSSDWATATDSDGGCREQYVTSLLAVLVQAVRRVTPAEWDAQLAKTVKDMEEATPDYANNPKERQYLQDAVTMMQYEIADWRRMELPDEVL